MMEKLDPRHFTHPSKSPVRCRAKVAHIGQSQPDPGLGVEVEVLKMFQVVLLKVIKMF